MENNRFLRHQVGCKGCEECVAGFPTLCNCGGLIHAEPMVTEQKDKFVTTGIQYNCDRCGTKFMRAKQQIYKGRNSRAHNNSRNNKPHESRTHNKSRF